MTEGLPRPVSLPEPTVWCPVRERLAHFTESQMEAVVSERDALASRVRELEGALSITNEALNKIGDYAHDRSTGPAVWDPLWEIRSMAYDNICEVDAALTTTSGDSHE